MNGRATQANGLLEQAAGRATTTKHGPDHNLISDESATFSQLEAKFAKAGHRLRQKTAPDGTVYYLASRWNLFRHLKGLEAAAAFLAVIGGL